MARRKRLSPATALTEGQATPTPDAVYTRSPITSVVADAAGHSAISEVAAEYAAARSEGRLVVSVPLGDIVVDHLVRDRLGVNSNEMETLKASIMSRGQQTPIEVEELGSGRFGLISGWRRLEALSALYAETGQDRFASAKALIRNLETISDAYVAMVEENEVRANLSFYERARIAGRAAERGVFPTAEIAVRELFRHASRAKRSKIQSFLRLYRSMDTSLRFPTTLSERQGLSLIKRLESHPDAKAQMKKALREAAPETAEAEHQVLNGAFAANKRASRSARPSADVTETATLQGVRLKVGPMRIELTGALIDEKFVADFQAWLAERVRSLK